MADLISREYVLAEYDRQHKGPPGGARKIIETAPAIDAEPLVRCKDCRFAKIENNYGFDEVTCFNEPFVPRCPVPLDWFCADGESKKQNNEFADKSGLEYADNPTV